MFVLVKSVKKMNNYTEEQVCNFWNIQLQLFQLSERDILNLFYLIYSSELYVENEYSNKLIHKYLYTSPFIITQEDVECLATHLALQLSGIDV